MNKKPVNPLLLIGMIGIFTAGSQFIADMYQAFYGNRNIYWTHQSMKLPIHKTGNDLQLFISGKPIQKHLADRTLFAADKNGHRYPVVSEDIAVRINNWHRVKSRILTKAVFTGGLLAISLTLLITGIFQVFGNRRRTGNNLQDKQPEKIRKEKSSESNR